MPSKHDTITHFLSTLTPSIHTFSYYTDWDKIRTNAHKAHQHLLPLTKIKQNHFEENFRTTLQQHPSILPYLPLLMACRKTTIPVAAFQNNEHLMKTYTFHPKKSLSNEDITTITEFMIASGIQNLLTSTENLMDLLIGIEIGLDSNGRKNRGGACMENEVHRLLTSLYPTTKHHLIQSANRRKIADAFAIPASFSNIDRIFDFVYCRNDRLLFIETNFFTGGGTKLKSVAGEFTTLNQLIKKQLPNASFLWITDGPGWRTSQNPLTDAFSSIDMILNVHMIQNGALDYLFN